MNILLLTADDLNYNSLGFTGCPIKDISPNLDKLASESLYFENAHVTIAVCQPSRSVMMTGRYPHRNGAIGFNPINNEIPTLTEQTHKHGFLNGIIGKETHIAPKEKFFWDYYRNVNQRDATEKNEEVDIFNDFGRNPKAYYNYTKEFLELSHDLKKPFFLMANSHDPHRPFALSDDENTIFGKQTSVRKKIMPSEIAVPSFLPDIPEVRREVAQYYTSVHRCDETIGAILDALKDSGFYDDTIILFLSDNGMAFPFAKTNCYLNSTKTPLLVKWPGYTKDGAVDREHMVSGIDLAPTILSMLNLSPLDDIDGKDFANVLKGEKSTDFSEVFTVFNITSGKRNYPMRCIINGDYGYILNLWCDGETCFKNESQDGLTFKAMVAESVKDAAIESRTKLFEFRVPEELYDIKQDPDALENLANDSKYSDIIQSMRKLLLSHMDSSDDFMKEQADSFIAKMQVKGV